MGLLLTLKAGNKLMKSGTTSFSMPLWIGAGILHGLLYPLFEVLSMTLTTPELG